MPSEATRIYRCAVYTRKSTEEGLEQDFNSLHAQRESCEAFIKSQKGEGWRLISKHYDDGGVSGGTMERPALKCLLDDIDAGKVDVVVVYKVDRLTRSLHDFSKMVEVFDRKGVSFVAVTQQFNTTTSMGRLTLNMLLSFAQFEREVTSERIRDKITASKQKGIWMGGSIPKGYKVVDKKLEIVPKEANEVRTIFNDYLACTGGIRELAIQLRDKGITARSRDGRPLGAISRGALQNLLRNPIYIGLIDHKSKLYPGQHKGIVDKEMWDKVQAKLKGKAIGNNKPHRKTLVSPLMGKLFDEKNRPLTPSHTKRHGKRYRYYQSTQDDRKLAKLKNENDLTWRLPAKEIEKKVSDIVGQVLADQSALAKTAIDENLSTNEINKLFRQIENLPDSERFSWVEKVVLNTSRILVSILLPTKTPIRIEKSLSMNLGRRGYEQKLVIDGPGTTQFNPDSQLIRALGLGLSYWARLQSDQDTHALKFAKEVGVDNRYLGRALPLSFLMPRIIENLVSGNQGSNTTAERLIRLERIPLCWEEQLRVIGAI